MIYMMDKEYKTLFQGHVGSKCSFESSIASCLKVEFVQADGHELNHCYNILGRSPIANRSVVTFVGDNARMIALNF